MMRTTLELDEKALDEVRKLTGEKNKGKAVNLALAEYIRRRKLDDLRKLLGTLELEDNWRELEELELAEMKDKSG